MLYSRVVRTRALVLSDLDEEKRCFQNGRQSPHLTVRVMNMGKLTLCRWRVAYRMRLVCVQPPFEPRDRMQGTFATHRPATVAAMVLAP